MSFGYYLVYCGLYSPTWIFDFRNLRRAVMMIVCSEFFLYKITSININTNYKVRKPLHNFSVLDFLFVFDFVLWPVFTDVNIWLSESEQSSDDDCVLRIFFFIHKNASSKDTHTMFEGRQPTPHYVFCWLYIFLFCGLYSPTWIFDFRNLSRAVMMIVCSVFFSFLILFD